jgi:type II secretory pathway pseudopilin PulG
MWAVIFNKKNQSKKGCKQRGDTIIEVLIALSVLGLVIASSIALANQSLAVGRAAQERVEGLKVAETQLELLRRASDTAGSEVFDLSESVLFCIDPLSNDITQFNESPDEIVGLEDPIEYPAECRLGEVGRYGVSISRSSDTFTLRVRWQSYKGNVIDEIKHIYRTYNFQEGFILSKIKNGLYSAYIVERFA